MAASLPRMKELYAAGKSTTIIGKELDLSRETVRKALLAAGVEISPRGKGRPQPPRKPIGNRQQGPLTDEDVQRLRRLVGMQ